MSSIGMKHLTNPHCYSGLAFGKGNLTSSYSPLWSPHGAYSYGDGGAYMIGSNTTALGGYGYGEADADAAAADAAANGAASNGASNGASDKKELMDHLKNPMVLAILAIGGYFIYQNMSGAKKVSNPRRRRRNGTKKGQRRKTARRAYMKKNALKVNRKKRSNPRRRKNASAHQKRAAKAMKLYHSGKAKTLKAAWKMV